MKIITFPVFLMAYALSCWGAPIDDSKAVCAIIGEAANQGPTGMLAVACAIRNRGSLDGVMGLKAVHIRTEPAWVWKRARVAWTRSATNDITGGATCWENEKAFRRPYWARYMRKTVVIGDHTFYRGNVPPRRQSAG